MFLQLELDKRCFYMFSGDILIFMPGQEDIEVTCDLIAGIFLIHVVMIPVIANCNNHRFFSYSVIGWWIVMSAFMHMYCYYSRSLNLFLSFFGSSFLPSFLSFYSIFCLLDGCFPVDFGQFIWRHIILLS